MSQEVVIRIHLEIPDGATFRIVNEQVEDDFEAEPLPPESWAQPDEPGLPVNVGPIGPAPAPGPVVVPAPQSAFRTFGTAPAGVMAMQEGMVHMQGHKPLKHNRKGLFCPTKIGTDPQGNAVWCPWPNAA